jgi:GDP-L-fucose synthase|tara:strand:+ start:2679 stop:3599 length:921 start_codon:yes stop_codon:yes gene_type:complete
MNVLVFGSRGLVGSSIVRELIKDDRKYNVISSSRQDTDLFSAEETKKKITISNPDIVIIAAAKVGGIHANNTEKFQFISENIKISLNIFESLISFPKTTIINIGSSCIYPLDAQSPLKEDSLMTGKLEPTNSPYAMAKLASLEMGYSLMEQYGHNVINIMPTNLYGPNDTFDELKSHVIPGLIYKMHKSKVLKKETVELWGSGKPLREFMYVQDFSAAVRFIIENNPKSQLLNIGTGEEISIYDLAYEIKSVVDFKGEILFNTNYPDGNPRKLLDSSKINELGWKSKVSLREGLEKTYEWFLENNN